MTHRTGNHYKTANSIYILAKTGLSGQAALVNIETGNLWSRPQNVGNYANITETEFTRLGGESPSYPVKIKIINKQQQEQQ